MCPRTLVRVAGVLFFAWLLSACGSNSEPTLVPVSASGGATSPAAATPGSTASLTARIKSPADGTHVALGTPIRLEGEGRTPGGTSLTDLRWHSSLDGPLGRGSNLTVPQLSPGIHRIRLEVRDGRGGRGTDEIVLVTAGPGGKTGKDLLSLLGTLPARLLGSPPQLGLNFTPMMRANPCRVNAAVGNGGLTAGVAADGTVSVLRWPSPSYDDQLDHLTTDPKAPRMGALADMGIFGGLAATVGGKRVVTWFRDAQWTTSQSYLSDEDNIVRTVHRHSGLDLEVTERLFVHPDRDVLVTRFDVNAGPKSPVVKADLIYFENLAPCTERIANFPIRDWLLDVLNDFALVYHSTEDALIHFRPRKADPSALAAFSAAGHPNLQAALNAFVDNAPSRFGDGAAFAIGGDAPADAHACGPDSAGAIMGKGPLYTAFDEIERAGGVSGASHAFIRASGALSRELDLSSGSDGWTIYAAAGANAGTARATLRWARSRTWRQHLDATKTHWRTWIGKATMPNVSDARIHAVCKRGLISVKTAMDKKTGAIVASVAPQLPYALDWPRDGAFINRALDEAGYPDLVEKHNEFYVKVQRKGFFLPGSTEMNYYADGTPGGPVLFEIDEAALLAWTLYDHVRFISSPAKKQAYLKKVYPAIRRAADLLTVWRDPRNGLPLPANEDDRPQLTQGMQGAETVYLALKTAVTAGRAVGEKASKIRKWEKRRDELKQAIEREFWNAKAGRFDDGSDLSVGAAAWGIWPVELLPVTDPRMTSTAQALHGEILPVFNKTANFGGYEAKTVIALAHAWRHDPAGKGEVQRLVRILTHEIPTPDTLHYGEFYDIVSRNGKRVYVNLNDKPHVWEHMLVYLAALEAHR